jgi:hypothetical protein
MLDCQLFARWPSGARQALFQIQRPKSSKSEPVVGRHSKTSAKQRVPSPSRAYSKRMKLLLSQRDALMAEIAILSTNARIPSSTIGKTRSLLTRYWSKADWQGREEILRAARWLLNVGKMHAFGGVARTAGRRKAGRLRRLEASGAVR